MLDSVRHTFRTMYFLLYIRWNFVQYFDCMPTQEHPSKIKKKNNSENECIRTYVHMESSKDSNIWEPEWKVRLAAIQTSLTFLLMMIGKGFLGKLFHYSHKEHFKSLCLRWSIYLKMFQRNLVWPSVLSRPWRIIAQTEICVHRIINDWKNTRKATRNEKWRTNLTIGILISW